MTPRERDEYMFLETFLAARERLVLSYVARDPRSGDTKDPSSILLTLRDYLGPELAESITRPRPPLLRHEDEAACAVIPAAARERQAAVLGAGLRRAAGAVELPAPGDSGPALAPELRPALQRLFHWPSPSARPAASTKEGRAGAIADPRRPSSLPRVSAAGIGERAPPARRRGGPGRRCRGRAARARKSRRRSRGDRPAASRSLRSVGRGWRRCGGALGDLRRGRRAEAPRRRAPVGDLRTGHPRTSPRIADRLARWAGRRARRCVDARPGPGLAGRRSRAPARASHSTGRPPPDFAPRRANDGGPSGCHRASRRARW